MGLRQALAQGRADQRVVPQEEEVGNHLARDRVPQLGRR
jgi:hypothetical protein